ncbi:LysR family transcriptional regulator [Pseudooceanicola sp. GBMRC 2024]|uniref:LysR family transcriptional regulator n=1 Tax=Pseudooceanicola albus TaxID=2692189 RepID=A0A6L7G2Z6_9RHOB|nr:LysR substrate-binding domain-containing protein [Pseudooceanicola albus]MXN17878.1 LysR family transcriptional regulator [Pseudooceanicola albus]
MRRYIPSLADLQAFEAAARYLSFTKASDDLGVTQSAVSRNIGNLERFLGARLFDRVGPRLVLTELGMRYYADVPKILARLEEVSIDVVRGRRARAALQIGATPTMVTRWLLPRLGRFFAAHPEIAVELQVIGDDEDFSTGEIDVALLRGAGQWRSTRAIELFPERLLVICAPAHQGAVAAPDLFDFSRLPALQNASRPSLWMTWLRLTGSRHDGTIQGHRFANSEMLAAAALRGLGFAVMPEHYVPEDLAAGRLVTPFGPPVASGEGYWLAIPERKWQDSRVQTFRRWLGAELSREQAALRR